MLFYKDLFRKIRESKCFTLEEIGKRVGVAKQTVQKWEKGTAKPRPSKVYDLAKVLGISAVDISDLKSEKWLIDSVAQNGNGNVAAVNDSSVVVGQPTIDAVEAFRSGLIAQIIDSDIIPEEKVKMLKIVSTFNKKETQK